MMYVRFPLSLRNVEDLLFERGIDICHETVRFLRKALRRQGQAEKIATGGLKSYPSAMRELGNENRREMGGWKNNRFENSRLPFRRQERVMQRFRRVKSLKKFASVHASIHNHFNSQRHLVDHQTFKESRSVSLAAGQFHAV